MRTKPLCYLSKKTATVMFAFALIVFGVFAWSMSENTVHAADYISLDEETNHDFAVAEYAADTAKTYIGQKAPTVDGYLFAGWYTGVECVEEQAIRSTVDVTDMCYAKFVPEDVLSIKVQVTEGDAYTATQSVEKNMRFVSSVDTLSYKNIGFRMKYKDDNQNWVYKISNGTLVYKRIVSATEGDEYTFSPKVVDTKSEYFITSTWKGENNTGIATGDYDTDYYVRAYWTTFDNVRVYGPTRYVSVNDGVSTNIINLPVKDATKSFEGKTLTASYTNSAGKTQSKTATLAYHDGTYAHLRINLGSSVNRQTALLSATKFTIKGGTTTNAIYRNLYTTHETSTTTANADSSWFTVYNTDDSTEKEYVIATSADLYGLIKLVNTDNNKCSGLTIYLVSDVAANNGTATDTGWTAASGATAYPWTPINGFAGRFDGQSHTISGINVAAATGIVGVGLFTELNNATIENLEIINSYYYANTSNGTGAVAGTGYGTFNNIHADVKIKDNAKGYIGGVIGKLTGNTQMTHCWNASNITTEKQYVGGMFGYNGVNGLTITLEHCLNTGNLTYTGAGRSFFGGLIGRANGTATTTGMLTVSDSLNLGIVSGTSNQTYMGGIAGFGAAGTGIAEYKNSYTAIQYDTDGTTVLGVSVLAGNQQANVTLTEARSIDYSKLTGVDAAFNTALDYVKEGKEGGNWVARRGDTPMLANFVSPTDKGIYSWFKLNEDGTGIIYNVDELVSFASQVTSGAITTDSNTVITLANDINLNEGWIASAIAPNNVWTPITNFAGTFNGGGHTISGLYMSGAVTGISGMGLFTQTVGATIQNLNVTNSYFAVDTSSGSGGVVGRGSGTIRNVYTNVTFVDNNTSRKGQIGGIVGRAEGDWKIENCWSNSKIESNWYYLGGILGYGNSNNIEISHCLNTGALIYTGTGDSHCGGIVGSSCSSSMTSDFTTSLLQITDCLSVGSVRGTTAQNFMGGVIGNAGGTDTNGAATVAITNSYAIDTLEPIGNDYGASLSDCRAVAEESILGELAITNTGLSFDEYWMIREDKTPMLVFFQTIDGQFGIPEYSTTGISSVHSLGENGYEICIRQSNKEEMLSYAAKLEEEGFTLHTVKTLPSGSKNVEDNMFYTYVGKSMNVYLSWNPGLATTRIIATPEELLPSQDIPEITADDNITASVTQMQFNGDGMLYVVQLVDGSFIVVDGGTNTYNSDKERLYSYLCEKTPDKIPNIVCWMYTHPDPDHIGLATAFLEEYAGKITIQSFAYNFAGEDYSSSSQDDAAIIKNIAVLESNMVKYYPKALKYNIHTGQSYYFKGVEIEILQTEEELYPNKGTVWNDTSAAWRMKFHTGQTVLFLGDSTHLLTQQLEDTYGDYMKSDILQLAHHGLIGGDLELYQYIDPDVCFWSTDEEKFNGTYADYEYKYCLGEGGCTYNAYLRDTSIKRRTHYHNGHMGVVNLNADGSIEAKAAYKK